MNKALKESKEIQKGTIKAAKNIESKRKKKDKNLTSIMEQFDQMQAVIHSCFNICVSVNVRKMMQILLKQNRRRKCT
jgi:uncharacterized membrane protein YdfJ with MMPL/SSD domain